MGDPPACRVRGCKCIVCAFLGARATQSHNNSAVSSEPNLHPLLGFAQGARSPLGETLLNYILETNEKQRK